MKEGYQDEPRKIWERETLGLEAEEEPSFLFNRVPDHPSKAFLQPAG
jgi:hypothetical protein